MKKSYNIGLIGCGLRGVYHLYTLRKSRLNVRLAAVADTDGKYAQIASRIFGDGNTLIFNSGEELLSATRLDAVIVASPNHVHRGPMVLAMDQKLKVLLEKPVAASVEDMAQMWQAYEGNQGELVIGFCLRYSPFYKKIKEIIDNGTLGQILQINAEELMSDELSMVFARGDWRPNEQNSGGLLLEKCCHDMDLINWLAGAKAKCVTSFAERTFLTPRDYAAPVCSECGEKDVCRFTKKEVVRTFETAWPNELHEMLDKLKEETCAFSPVHTYPDHQAVVIKYENGVLCNFTVAQVQTATRRTIHILGSEARLYGVLSDNKISLYRRENSNDESVEIVEVQTDDSGHNGSDSGLGNDFYDLLEGRHNQSRPGLREGIEAALLCLAADKSAKSGGVVALESLRADVFKDKKAGVL